MSARSGLRGAHDRQIWDYARNKDFVIVSKDTDFQARSSREGAPPKVVWLAVGNVGTKAIEGLLRSERESIKRFAKSEECSFLILSLSSKTI